VRVLQKLLTQTLAPGALWSVNFPHLEPGAPEPEIIFCSLCTRPLLTEFVKQEDGIFMWETTLTASLILVQMLMCVYQEILRSLSTVYGKTYLFSVHTQSRHSNCN